jgi:hypothetical protein
MNRFQKFASLYFSGEMCVIFGGVGAIGGFYYSIWDVNQSIISNNNRRYDQKISLGQIVVLNLSAGFCGILGGAVSGVAAVPGIPMLIFASPIIAKTYYDYNYKHNTDVSGSTVELK